MPAAGQAGTLYLTLDTKNLYYYNDDDKMYEEVVASGMTEDEIKALVKTEVDNQGELEII